MDRNNYRNAQASLDPFAGSFAEIANQRSLLTSAIHRLEFRNDPEKKKGKALIAALRERDFGGALIAALLLGERDGRELATSALAAHADAFSRLSEARKQAFGQVYRFWIKTGESVREDLQSSRLYALGEIFGDLGLPAARDSTERSDGRAGRGHMCAGGSSL